MSASEPRTATVADLIDAASWITSASWMEDRSGSLPVLAARFRHDGRSETIVLHLAVAGIARVEVNGRPITRHVLEPGYVDHSVVLEVTEYDITEIVRDGSNTVRIELGPGTYVSASSDGRWTQVAADFGDLCARAVIVAGHGTSAQVLTATGPEWRGTVGGTVRSNWTGGEDFDAERDRAAHVDRQDEWAAAAAPLRPPVTRLVPRSSPAVALAETFEAVLVEKTYTKSFAVDFGQNIAGWPEITVPARSRVTIVPAEIRHPDGVVDARTEGWGPVFHTVTTGEHEVTWSPRFMYNGFRYLDVRGLAEADTSMFRARVITADVPQSGAFTCSDPLLDRIDDLIVRAVRSNAFSVFTDCPQREKLGYLEQLHLVFDSIVRNIDARPVLDHMVDLMIGAQREDGSIGLWVPEWEEWEHPWREDANFAGAIGFLPWLMYREYGDPGPLLKALPTLLRYLEHVEEIAEGGLLRSGLGDWDGRAFRHVTTVESTTWHRLLVIAAEACALGGDVATGRRVGERAARLRERLRADLLGEDGRLREVGAAELSVTLTAGILTADEEAAGVDELERLIVEGGYSVDVGEMAMASLVSVLTRHRRDGTLLQMCRVTDRPGYGYMVAHGATALTETWDGPTFGFSQNHFMNAAISTWFSQGVLGITQPASSVGYSELKIEPRVAAGLTAASGWYDTPRGRVVVDWTLRDGVFSLTGSAPDAGATVILPSGAQHRAAGEFVLEEPF
ncbi:family 78 glycoside hydrolase catalytic domain [Microbacterium sp. 2MCAF23]|uniref:family 78 glycoside hydrolase catalytic domain n=1 Tax=Microbacterium sp. 2MCAF23 TaxID=3232985 RepID=UPI003F96AA6B